MEYRESAPVPALDPFVARVWTLTGDAHEINGAVQPVLPDGHPELILHFGDAFERVTGATAERQPAILFAGQLTGQLTLRPSGRIGVLGIRFRPFGATALLKVPQHELAGFTIDLECLNKHLASALKSVLSATDGAVEAASLVQQILLQHVDASRVDIRVRAAVTTILASYGALGVDAVARQAEMTRRHLERKFLEAVGLPPKRLARVARFQRALRLLEEADSPRRGTETAADCGYADQSHFIREFRELAGCSPSQHLVQQGALTGFFLLS